MFCFRLLGCFLVSFGQDCYGLIPPVSLGVLGRHSWFCHMGYVSKVSIKSAFHNEYTRIENNTTRCVKSVRCMYTYQVKSIIVRLSHLQRRAVQKRYATVRMMPPIIQSCLAFSFFFCWRPCKSRSNNVLVAPLVVMPIPPPMLHLDNALRCPRRMPCTRVSLLPGRHINHAAALHAVVVVERSALRDSGFVFAPAGVPDDFEGAHCLNCGRWSCKSPS